jgi:hypothetical protein
LSHLRKVVGGWIFLEMTFELFWKLRSGASSIHLFIVRLVKLKIADNWRFSTPGLSLTCGHEKCVHLRVTGNAVSNPTNTHRLTKFKQITLLKLNGRAQS